MSAEGQHPIASEAAAHANRVYATADDKRQMSRSQDFQNTCEACFSSSFSETEGLRLDELKDKLSKLAKVTSDPDLKSRVTDLMQATDRLDTWQLRHWQEIQTCIRAVCDAKHTTAHSPTHDHAVLGYVSSTQAPLAGKRIVKTTNISGDRPMADDREREAAQTPFLARFIRFLRQLYLV